MTSKEIGDIIFHLKKRQGITGKQLCSGICSNSTLFRFESGETPIDYLSLKYLLSRLGKSINKVDNMLTFSGFEFLTIHSMMDEYLISGDLDSAQDLLDESIETKDFPEQVYSQYFKKVQCVIHEKQGVDSSILINEIISALEITIPSFCLENIDKYLLAEDEWLLLFMLLEQSLLAGSPQSAKDISNVYSIFNNKHFDQEAWIMLYPKIAWLYMQICTSIDERIAVCENVLLSLRENTRLLHLDAFVEAKCALYKEKYGESDPNYIHVQRQYDALKWIYEDAGRQISHKPEMWFSINNPEIYLLPEVVRSERSVQHLSQEAAGDKYDIDQKTFSRIETGTSTPKPSTLNKIKETLGIYRGIHNTLLVVSDFEDLELENRLTRAISAHKYEMAQELLNELRPRLSLSHKENLQYIDYTQTTLDFKMGLINFEEAIYRCIKAFEITRPYDEKSFHQVVLSRIECMIIHFISSIYRDNDEIQHSLSLLENVMEGFTRSSINPKHHYRELSIILLSLSYDLQYINQPEHAMHYCQKGLSLQFDFYRSNMIHYFLTQKYYILESINPASCIFKESYKKIFISESLLTKEHDFLLENYFFARYGENILD